MEGAIGLKMFGMGSRVRPACAFAAAVACAALASTPASAETTSFTATGVEHVFTVPAGTRSINVVAIGGHGGTGDGPTTTIGGGAGAVVSGTLAVAPGQVLYIAVGGNGQPAVEEANGGGGFNGGALVGPGSDGQKWGGGGGGGGASDVRTVSRSAPDSLASRLIVAAGGGGGGGADGGGGGGAAGANGSGATYFHETCPTPVGGGGAGQPGAGGAGGTPGSSGVPGEPGTAGVGGKGGSPAFTATGGGGGGGGLFGGGGGGGGGGCLSNPGGGGGGGSSGFAASVSGAIISIDGGGVPSVTLTYTSKDEIAPVLGSLLLSPSAFEAANIGPALISAVVGTNIVYEVSEPVTTTFTVQRPAKGFRKGRKCVAKRRAGKARPCTRYRTVGSFSHGGGAGLNRVRFTGRLKNKPLKLGKYRVQAVARDSAGNASKPKSKRFKIVG
jgi:Glycine rich protein